MKCFYFFKEKSKKNEERSKPVSSNEGSIIKSPNSGARRTTGTSKSSNSGVSITSSQRSIPELYEERAHNLRVFTFPELRAATNDFSLMLKIGEGGFGSVFKGFIKPPDDSAGDQTVVAVKKLNKNGFQGHKQWMAEVQFLAVVDHPNLVKLVGYCALDSERGIQRLLVYEFMPNKSLDDHLFSKALPALPWHIRLQIALGAAQGLTYLHEELEVQVIYRDFKTSNVLLDEDFKPKLSDFGLAREGPTDGHTHVSTAIAQFRGKIGRFGDLTAQTAVGIMNPGFFLNPRFQYQEGFLYSDSIKSGVTKVIERLAPDVTFAIEATREVVGTYGYAAPDYVHTGHLTTKSDVWSFGVVLYEILTGRRILERNLPTNEQKLLEWVKQYPPDGKRFFMIMDPRLEGKYSLTAACSIAKLADTCLSKYSKDRPKMSGVVESLKQAIQISETGNDPETNIGSSEIETEADTKPSDQVNVSDDSRRRITRLARLREHMHGVGRRRFVMMQEATVP